MADWTDDEIEAAMKSWMLSLGQNPYSLVTARKADEPDMVIGENRLVHHWRHYIDHMRAALSAVRRVPEGCWIAPDEPTEEMIKAAVQASGFDEAKNAVKVLENAGVLNVVAFKWTGDIEYRAMRDSHKGSKADG